MSDRLGVLLVQLGGPASRAELRPFLYELFVDPEILGIRFAPLRRLVAWVIATLRAPTSAATYERIGWSPIRRWSEAQARLLEAELAKRSGGAGPVPVVRVGMTCSAPFVETALEELRAAGAARLFVLPLYPQYSVTTTRGSFNRVTSALAKMGWAPERRNAPDAWYEEPGFVAAHVARIRAAAATLPEPDPARTVVLYSAHSLPVKTIERQKDPYPRHIEETVRILDAALGGRYRSRLGYQSKVGPVEWIGPSTPEVLAELANAGEKQVLVVPIAFVSDHVETLYEIRMLFAGEAARLGIPHYAVAEGLNDHPEFIRGLAGVVEKAAA
ncbi:MAG: ferrochelatase [Thermoanaerobaculia bacterium]|nr:ferrochelatase [Thermoanaerobaculia bacterium]